MRQTKTGRIVFLSGGGATSPMPNISAYAASKAGIVRLVESLALEVEDEGITINAVAPGLMATDMLDELLAQDRETVGADFYDRMVAAKKSGGDSMSDALDLITFLAGTTLPGLTGRLISAKWDPWRTWTQETEELRDRNLYTLRRTVPADS
jgi:3-oxoacyl-[acyl-carrier protein] reductase